MWPWCGNGKNKDAEYSQIRRTNSTNAPQHLQTSQTRATGFSINNEQTISKRPIFSGRINHTQKPRPLTSNDERSQFHTKHLLKVTCSVGVVTQAEAQGIVTGEGSGMLGASMVTKALCNQAQMNYENLQNFVKKQYGSVDLKNGKVYCLNTERFGIRLQFRIIFLAVVLRFCEGDDERRWRNCMEQLYADILMEADNECLESVALPLLGSENAGSPIEVAVDALVRSFCQYSPKSLKHVLVVSFHDDVHNKIVEQFQNHFSNESKQHTEEEPLLKVNNSKHFSTKVTDEFDDLSALKMSPSNDADRFKIPQPKVSTTEVFQEFNSGTAISLDHHQLTHSRQSRGPNSNQDQQSLPVSDSIGRSVAISSQNSTQQNRKEISNIGSENGKSKDAEYSQIRRRTSSTNSQHLQTSQPRAMGFSINNEQTISKQPIFSGRINHTQKPRPLTSNDERSQFHTKNLLKITCSVGDVTQAEAQGIVTGEGSGMLGASMVTKALCNQAQMNYENLRNFVKKQYDSVDLKNGKVYCLNTEKFGIRLQFRIIFLAVVLRFCEGDDERWWRNCMEQLYADILMEADNECLESVALPLLGSGNAGSPIEVAVDALVRSFCQYSPKSLKHVLVVSFHDNVHNKIVKQFQNHFSNESKQHTEEPLLKVNNSKHFSTKVTDEFDDLSALKMSPSNDADPFKIQQPKISTTEVFQEFNSGTAISLDHHQLIHSRQSRGPNSNQDQQSLPVSDSIGRSVAISSQNSTQQIRKEISNIGSEEFTTGHALMVRCYIGDVTLAAAEGIVTGEGYGMTSASMVTKAICERWGISYRELGTLVVDKYGTADLDSGDVYCLKRDRCKSQLNFKLILIAIVLRINHARDPTDWINHMGQLYLKILKKADRKKLQSVAMPLLGSGRAGAPIELAVLPLIQSLSRFKPNCLRNVLLVSFQDDVHVKIVQQCKELFSRDVKSFNIQDTETASIEVRERSLQDFHYRDDVRDGGNRMALQGNASSDHTKLVQKQDELLFHHDFYGTPPESELRSSAIPTSPRHNINKESDLHIQNQAASTNIQIIPSDASTMTHFRSTASVHSSVDVPAPAYVTHITVDEAASQTNKDQKTNSSDVHHKEEHLSVSVTGDSSKSTKRMATKDEYVTVGASHQVAAAIEMGAKQFEKVGGEEVGKMADDTSETAVKFGEFVSSVEHPNNMADQQAAGDFKSGKITPSEYKSPQSAETIDTETMTGYTERKGGQAKDTTSSSELSLGTLSNERKETPKDEAKNKMDSSGPVSNETKETPKDEVKTEMASSWDTSDTIFNECKDEIKSQNVPEPSRSSLPSESCVICMDAITNPKTLHKCGHTFCTACIDNSFNFKPVCPTCNTVYGALTGDQPPGKIADKFPRHPPMDLIRDIAAQVAPIVAIELRKLIHREGEYPTTSNMHEEHRGKKSQETETTSNTLKEHRGKTSEENDSKHVQQRKKSAMAPRVNNENPSFSETAEKSREIPTLLEEIKHLKEEKECKICFESELNIIFLPCGHLVCCEMCSNEVSECPVCRKHIVKKEKVYRI